MTAQLALPLSGRRLPRVGSKARRLLGRLAQGERLHCLLPDVHTSCLHSDISALERRYGVEIYRRPIEVAAYSGTTARVAEYWVNGLEAVGIRDLMEADA